MNEENWSPARLIPISGIRGAEEQERRATSALLAVLTAVREFGREILKPLGAPTGKVEAFCEVPFELDGGRKVRVDGVVRVTRGKRTWTILVEVKTGKSELERDQVEAYLDVAKQEGFDGLLTISNRLARVHGYHPVTVDGRRYRNVGLYHLSWSRILAVALRVNDHIGVEDPDQDWILSELIRYLQYDGSGVRSFDGMGGDWNPLRTGLREGTLRRGDEVAEGVAFRWQQLLQHISLSLAARLGGDVHPVMSRKESADPGLQTSALSRQLVEDGSLSGAIAIPNAIAPIEVNADVKSALVSVSVTVQAPLQGRSRARLSWLLRQLRDAPDALRVDIAFERTRFTTSGVLNDLRNDTKSVLQATDRLPRAFILVQTRRVGMRPTTGAGSFAGDTANLLDEFYREVVQGLKAWTPPAPKLAEEKPEADELPPAPESQPEAAAAGS